MTAPHKIKDSLKHWGLYNMYINVWAYKTFTRMNFPCDVLGKWRSLYDMRRRETLPDSEELRKPW